MSSHPSLAEVLSPREVSSTELRVQWHEVRRRVKRTKQVRAAVAVIAVALISVAGVAKLKSDSTSTLAVGETALAEVDRTVQLADGSKVMLAAASSLSLSTAQENEVVLSLDDGSATFDVAKRPSRKFVVRAGGVEVRVVGTKFTVNRHGAEVSVAVERGIVEVREGDQITRLTAGQSWPAALEDMADEEEVGSPLPTGGDGQGEGKPKAASPTRRHKTRPVDRGAAPTPVEPTANIQGTPLPLKTAAPTTVETTPAEAFNAAMSSRSSGHTKAAILGFQHVCERWPSSAYAPMSAFEWGRLALDVEDDPRQAARAFERTLELATSVSLVEDTLARLTEAYARYDLASCRRVQADYLKRFPAGPHVRGVTKACPP